MSKLDTLLHNEEELNAILACHLAESNKKRINDFSKILSKFIVDGEVKFKLSFNIYAACASFLYFIFRRLYRGLFWNWFIMSAAITVWFSICNIFFHINRSAVYYQLSELHQLVASEISIELFTTIVTLLIIFLGKCIISFVGVVAQSFTANYFYAKKFVKDLDIAGYGELELEQVFINMRRLGGKVEWARTAGIITFAFLTFILLVFMSGLAVAYYYYYTVALYS